jgi:uncharacterized protein (TIGR00297 family)
VPETNLKWQSKLVLLLVLPAAAASVVLQAHWWAVNDPSVAIWAIGVSLLLGFVVLALHAATPGGAFTGTVITASLIFATAAFYPAVARAPWRSALAPVLAVALLAHFSTRLGRAKKERLGTAEGRRGRTAAQVAANLGVAAIITSEFIQMRMIDSHWFSPGGLAPVPIFAPMLAALAEAAADTVSSEIGQVLGGKPRLITTLRAVDPGTDGAISLIGTLAGVVAAAIVAAVGTLAFYGQYFQPETFWIATAGGVFGLLFDSLLGATLERRGWLNNDLVNFLSTASAAAFALGLLALIPHHGIG